MFEIFFFIFELVSHVQFHLESLYNANIDYVFQILE